MKKKCISLFSVGLLLFTLMGCADTAASTNPIDNKNTVSNIMNSQINSTAPSSPTTSASTKKSEGETALGDVDYDLTDMNADMTYAMVFDMSQYPDKYVGKTFSMKGLYYPYYFEINDRTYLYCIIPDALACCSQGIEFSLEDQEDPDLTIDTEIIVKGTFVTYDEDTIIYFKLDNADLEVI